MHYWIDPASVTAATAVYRPGSVHGPRYLADCELVWMTAGSARWSAEGLPDRVLRPGSVILLTPGLHDRFDWDAERTSRHGYAHFTVCGSPPPLTGPLSHDFTAGDPVAALLDHLVALPATGQDEAARATAAAHFIAAVLAVMFAAGLSAPGAHLPEPLRAAARYTALRWSREGPVPLTLAQLASAAAVSRSYLSRLSRRHLGVPVMAALEAARLERAAVLLRRPDASVHHVATQTGFTDPLYFSRRFTALYASSPTAFRTSPPAPPPPLVLRARPFIALLWQGS